MPLPLNTEYNEAIQNPATCFLDPELRRGEPETDVIGLPRPRAGNFADVYRLHCPSTGNTWAVKCFTREVRDLQERYQAIHTYLIRLALPFMVEFQYQPQGIRVRGQCHPILKMRWIEGLTLNEFVRDQVDKPHLLEKLAGMWLKLAQQLRRVGIAHADLQHGNVLLVPGSKAQALGLRLIDYDGMFVPTLFDRPSSELGHPNYQHPQRLREGLYNADVDRFPHLVIYTALRCLMVGGRPLWDRYDTSENLLFRELDFSQPQTSQLLVELFQLEDPWVRTLLGHLVLASQTPLDEVPLVDELIGRGGRPMALNSTQERRVRSLLPPGAWSVHHRKLAAVSVAGGAFTPEARASQTLLLPESPPDEEPLVELLPGEPVEPLVELLPGDPVELPAGLQLIPPHAIRMDADDLVHTRLTPEGWLSLLAASAGVFVLLALLVIGLRLATRPGLPPPPPVQPILQVQQLPEAPVQPEQPQFP